MRKPPVSALIALIVLGATPLVLGAAGQTAAPAHATSAVSTAATTTRTAARRACPPVTRVRSGSQRSAIFADNRGGTWNLSRAVWNENAPDHITYPVRSDAWRAGCIVGGRVNGNVPRSWTRDQWYNAQDGGHRMGGEAFRQVLTDTPGNWLRIRGAYAEDYEDAFDPDAARHSSTTYLQGVHAFFIRDDGIENENVPHNMVVRDSLFDGVFTAFAERPSGSTTASNGHGAFGFTVQGSLVYVRPQPLGPEYCDAGRVEQGRCKPTTRKNVWMGAYGIWKWSDQAARQVVVRNTVFRLDMPSYSSCQSQEWPDGTYENVTLVWTGKGAYRDAGDCTNELPSGVRLTRDLSVWTDAKQAWLARH